MQALKNQEVRRELLILLPNGRIHKFVLPFINISFREAPLTATMLAALTPQDLPFLVRSWRAPLRMKRLVFENAPRITPQGTVNCCDFCPNSTVRDGKVVPVCLADHKNELNL